MISPSIVSKSAQGIVKTCKKQTKIVILKLIDTRDLDFIIGSDEQFKNENITKIFKQWDKV